MEGQRRRKKSEPDQINLLPLKKGPFHLALSLEFDIVVVIIVGSSRVWGADSYLPRKGTIFVKCLKKIPFEEIRHMDHNELRNLI